MTPLQGWRERFAPWAAIVAICWPLAVYPYAASYDLPFHEEVVAALRYHGDPSRYPPGFFVWRLGMPNQLFYFLALPLTFVVSVHVACTIVLAAAVASIPLGAAHLADHLGKSRWAGVVVAPVAVGYFFNGGFVGTVLGLGLFLALLPRLDRFVCRPTRAGAVEAVLLLLLLDLAHESALTFALVALVTLTIGQPLRARAMALRLVPLVVGVAAIAIVHTLGNALQDHPPHWHPSITFTPLIQKEEELPRMLLGRHDPDRMGPATYTLAATFLLLALDAVRVRGRPRPRKSGLGAIVSPHRFLLLGGLLIFFYFNMPWEVNGASFLNQRYLSPGVAVLAVAVAPRAKRGPSLVTRGLSIAAIGACVALQLPAFATTSATLRELDQLTPLIAPGSAVGNMERYGPAPRTYVFSVGGAVTRVTAARGGRTPSSFLHDSPIPPLVIAPQYRWNDLEFLHQGIGLRPAYDLRQLRYFIVWLRNAQIPDASITAAMAPDARFVARSGGWVLYESTHDVVPIDSPELPVPPGAEMLIDRLEKANATR